MIHPDFQQDLTADESLNDAIRDPRKFHAMVQRLSSDRCTTRLKGKNVCCLCDYDLQPLTFVFEDEGGKKLSISLGKEDLMLKIGRVPQLNKDICRLNILGGA